MFVSPGDVEANKIAEDMILESDINRDGFDIMTSSQKMIETKCFATNNGF